MWKVQIKNKLLNKIFEDKIKFINEYNNLNEKVKCKLSNTEDNIIECKGIYDFTGEYKISDDNGVLITLRSINIIPPKGGKYDIDNFLENKVNLDDGNLLKKLFFSPNILNNLNKGSILIIETEELSYINCNRIMYIYKGDNSQLFNFGKNVVNAQVLEEGGIEVPKGNNFIRVNLENDYEEFLSYGFIIKGYGFSIKAVYLEKNQLNLKYLKGKFLSKRFKYLILGLVILLI